MSTGLAPPNIDELVFVSVFVASTVLGLRFSLGRSFGISVKKRFKQIKYECVFSVFDM